MSDTSNRAMNGWEAVKRWRWVRVVWSWDWFYIGLAMACWALTGFLFVVICLVIDVMYAELRVIL